MAADSQTLEPLKERLKTFDGFLERLSKEYGMSTLELVRHLPDEDVKIIDGDKMLALLTDVGEWGAVLFITEGNSVITGMSVEMPQVFLKDGYYHFFGQGGFGGHIEENACRHIAFIERHFQGRNSHSIHFYDDRGEPMFKIFVSRELSGDMKPEQVERWGLLKQKL
ncbi:MAG: heme utilization cystosolic carrier protein HutX [Pseudomonadota bacterium]